MAPFLREMPSYYNLNPLRFRDTAVAKPLWSKDERGTGNERYVPGRS